MVRLVLLIVIGLSAVSAGCAGTKSPDFRVVGVNSVPAREVVFVQVTNPANRPMRLTKLEYTFASAGGATVSEGEVLFEREVPAGEAIVVEVPLDTSDGQPVTLRGKLTTELDQIVRIFQVSAEIQPDESL